MWWQTRWDESYNHRQACKHTHKQTYTDKQRSASHSEACCKYRKPLKWCISKGNTPQQGPKDQLNICKPNVGIEPTPHEFIVVHSAIELIGAMQFVIWISEPRHSVVGHFWEWLLTAVLEQCPRASVPCSRNLFALVSPYSPAMDCTAIDRRENFLPMTNCTTARRQIFLIFDKHSFRWTIPKAVWIFKMRDKQKMVQARM